MMLNKFNGLFGICLPYHFPDDGIDNPFADGTGDDKDVLEDDTKDKDDTNDDDVPEDKKSKDDDSTDSDDKDSDSDDDDEEGEDKDNEEEDKEPKEEEEEEEEEEDDTKRVTTWTDIKAKYPTIHKEFPDLKPALFREQRFSEIFGSIEDAEKANENSEILGRVEDDIFNEGNPTNLLDTVKKQNPKSYEKVITAILPYLQKNDKELYYRIASVPIKQMLRGALRQHGKDHSIGKAAGWIHQFFFDNMDFDADVEGTSPKAEESETEKRLKERLSKIEEREAGEFQKSIDSSYISSMNKFIRSGLDTDERLTNYMKSKLVDDILQDIKKQLNGDTRYISQMRSLYNRTKTNGTSSDLKSSIVNAALARAKSLVPNVRKRLVSEALGKKEKTKNKEDREEKKIVAKPKSSSSNRDNGNGKKPSKPLTDLDVLRN